MSTIISECSMPVADGVGTIGVTVYDEDGVELIARSTAGVVQIFDGSDWGLYMKKITVADTELRGVCVWDDGDDNATAKPFQAPFTDSQLAALRALAVNVQARTIDDLTTPKNVKFDL